MIENKQKYIELVRESQTNWKSYIRIWDDFALVKTWHQVIVENQDFLGMVLGNHFLPNETLKELANRRDPTIRSGVARNISLPIESLEKLAHDNDSRVRNAVNFNPSTPEWVLEELRNDEIDFISEYAEINYQIRNFSRKKR